MQAKKRFQLILNRLLIKLSFFPPTTPVDIESLINCIKPNLYKSIGPNSIPANILKEFKIELSERLSDMINVSSNKVTFPDFLKVANVIPIHKKSEKLDSNNYRPISLLSNIGYI